MVAGSSKSVRGAHSHETGISAIPRLLKAAAILGPNGAGKSTLVSAMYFMRQFVVSSARDSQEGEEIGVEPFLFSQTTVDKPSTFEAIFIENGTRYQYGFSATKSLVVKEWLYATPAGKKSQKWFERDYDFKGKRHVISVSQSVKGEKEVWKKSTRDNALFLSVAVQLKAETFLEPFDWFRKRLRVVKSSQRLHEGYSAAKCAEDDKDKVLSFLQTVDVNISDIKVSEKDVGDMLTQLPLYIREPLIKGMSSTKRAGKTSQVYLGHTAEGGETVFLPLAEESDGTKVLFALSGPWLDVLANGRILVVDELHNSLHPLAFEFLITLFQDLKWNEKFAQIVFTTHETHFMSQDTIIHRDGIWLAKLDGFRGTKITPLSDFQARIGEAFDRGYLGGRYGSIPRIRGRSAQEEVKETKAGAEVLSEGER
ncbi:AAA family ATPase [Lichenicoccus sp.]|uniref:AAA family ATPase n=1 Tax=Lichenicoccus sp. TaxID=2781899 RepID=UPI003D0EB1B1